MFNKITYLLTYLLNYLLTYLLIPDCNIDSRFSKLRYIALEITPGLTKRKSFRRSLTINYGTRNCSRLLLTTAKMCSVHQEQKIFPKIKSC